MTRPDLDEFLRWADFTPTEFQRRLLDALYSNPPPARIECVNLGRRYGYCWSFVTRPDPG